MAGVAQHSRTSPTTSPAPRLRRTAEYVTTCIAFGTTAQADAAAAGSGTVHRMVRGIDQVTGLALRRRRSGPAALQGARHRRSSSFLDAVRRGGLPLTDDKTTDEFYAGNRSPPPNSWAPPGSRPARAEVADYTWRMSAPELQASSVAREAAVAVWPCHRCRCGCSCSPRPGPAWAGVAAAVLAAAVLGTPVLRAHQGLPGTELAATVALRGLRAAALSLRLRSPHAAHGRRSCARRSQRGHGAGPAAAQFHQNRTPSRSRIAGDPRAAR